jgi:hypothetical protein
MKLGFWMFRMCVYMHSRFVENHLIRVLKDEPLISEVVLSHFFGCQVNPQCKMKHASNPESVRVGFGCTHKYKITLAPAPFGSKTHGWSKTQTRNAIHICEEIADVRPIFCPRCEEADFLPLYEEVKTRPTFPGSGASKLMCRPISGCLP